MEPVMPTIPKHLMREEQTAAKAHNNMGKDDFLKMLMTQLQHQDPVNPMNQEQFATQLAQFTQLEQLANIGKGIENLNGGRGEEAKLQALGMIGKEVRASGSRVDLQGGQAVALKYLPDAEATPVKATIYDQGGTLVREMEIAGRDDNAAVVWDGKDNAGNAVASGKYGFKIHGVDRNGQSKELGSEVSGRVTGIETEGGSTVLIVDTGSGPTKIELAKVSRVSLPSDKAAVAPQIPGLIKPEAGAQFPKGLPKVIQLGQLEEGGEAPEAPEAPTISEVSDNDDGAEGKSHGDMSQLIGRFGR